VVEVASEAAATADAAVGRGPGRHGGVVRRRTGLALAALERPRHARRLPAALRRHRRQVPRHYAGDERVRRRRLHRFVLAFPPAPLPTALSRTVLPRAPRPGIAVGATALRRQSKVRGAGPRRHVGGGQGRAGIYRARLRCQGYPTQIGRLACSRTGRGHARRAMPSTRARTCATRLACTSLHIDSEGRTGAGRAAPAGRSGGGARAERRAPWSQGLPATNESVELASSVCLPAPAPLCPPLPPVDAPSDVVPALRREGTRASSGLPSSSAAVREGGGTHQQPQGHIRRRQAMSARIRSTIVRAQHTRAREGSHRPGKSGAGP